MVLKDMLDKLRLICDELINTTEDKKYKLIKDILENDQCFFEMDTNTALSILLDLGFEKEEAKKIYIKILNKDNFVD